LSITKCTKNIVVFWRNEQRKMIDISPENLYNNIDIIGYVCNPEKL